MASAAVHLTESLLDYPRARSPAAPMPPRRTPMSSGASQVAPTHLHHPQAQIHHAPQGYAIPPRNADPSPTEHSYPRSSPLSSFRATSTSQQQIPGHSPSPPAMSHPPRRSSSNANNSFATNRAAPPVPTVQYNIHRSGTNNSTTSNGPRRSTSSRSSIVAPTSYVALMRKQKATVWCDRSQSLDHRAAAALKAAKHRAALEVHGAGTGGRTATLNSGKVRSAKSATYVQGNLSGVTLPPRLSTNEMLGDEEEPGHDGRSMGGEASGSTARLHNRSGSGRSSVHSGKYPSGYPRTNTSGRFSTGGTPPLPNDGYPSPDYEARNPSLTNVGPSDYFNRTSTQTSGHSGGSNGNPGPNQSTQNLNTSKTNTPGSEEEKFGDASELRSPNRQTAVAIAAEQAKHQEELRRRGSVDERTMTMPWMGMGGKGRLFVANPDLDD